MKTYLCIVTYLSLYLLLLFLPSVKPAAAELTPAGSGETATLYQALDLAGRGLSEEIFLLAMRGYDKLDAQSKLRNNHLLTIVDFSQSSRNKRFYVIDLIKKSVLFQTYVAHGRNTGEEFARHFSNQAGSWKSSLGFYLTKESIISSGTGFSLLLEGLEKGFNDNALEREIIIHGADYATESFIRRTGRLGRSFGCPSLPPDQVKPVVETIREGSCLFIYSPDPQYLSNSPLLSGHNTGIQ